MKKFIAVCFAVLMTASLSGCGNSGAGASNSAAISDSADVSKTAIESLSSEEKQIFDALVIAADNFYTPQSIKVLSVKNIFGSVLSDGTVYEDMYGPRCSIEISAENKAGGSTKKKYILWTSEMGDSKNETVLIFAPQVYHKNGTIAEYYDDKCRPYQGKERDFENVNIGNLNRALTQYWQDLGL